LIEGEEFKGGGGEKRDPQGKEKSRVILPPAKSTSYSQDLNVVGK